MKRLTSLTLLAITISATGLSATQAGANQTEYYGPPKAKTAVILAHPGGYAIGDNSLTRPTAQALGQRGVRAINLTYPLFDLRGAEKAMVRAARQAARRHRIVYAYGESAGGGLAALVAARHLVDGAVVWAPVSDLNDWYSRTSGPDSFWQYFPDTSQATLNRLSAIRYANRHSSPLTVVHGRDDQVVPISQSRHLKNRWLRMNLIERSGGHELYNPSAPLAQQIAIDCFASKQCFWPKAKK